MPATPAWLAAGEALLNRSIAASAQAEALARRLQGTSLQVDVEGYMRIRAAAVGGRLALLADESDADAIISGSPSALLRLFKGGALIRAPAAPAAQIRGDAQIAGLYRELFALARPDPEEELARLLGDLPARGIMRLASGAAAWSRHARRTAGKNIAEYLQEESRDLIAKSEAEEFLRSVDELRESVDRLEARLRRLEQRFPSAP